MPRPSSPPITKSSSSEVSIHIGVHSKFQWLHLVKQSDEKEISNSEKRETSSCLDYIFRKWFRVSTPRRRYCLDKLIGKGSFGKVYQIIRLSDHKVFACKFQNKCKTLEMYGGNLKEAVKRVRMEIELGLRLQHPNIVKIHEIMETNTYISIVMERMYGGNLCSYAMRRDLVREEHVAVIVSQIVAAVDFIHSKNLIHRDIKLENIMLMKQLSTDDFEAPVVKLIDFGCSRSLCDGSNAESFVGSGYFAAPEIFLRLGHNNKVDMWSVGVVTFVCLSGKFPFHVSGPICRYVRGQKTDPHIKPKDWIGISETALDFTKKLLCFEPSNRMSALKAAKHPWLLRNKQHL